MRTISIIATKLTPSITLNAKKGLIEIEGNSIMDDAVIFYKPVLEFINTYTLKPSAKTKINIKLQYITLPSSKSILEILKKLESLHKTGMSKVTVNWSYSLDEMLSNGKNYQSIIQLPFKMIEV
jgi:hypothetical protein